MGGAHIDRNGTMKAPYIVGSSIPGVMSEDIGGGGFNIACNLARLDIPVTFSSPRADDSLTFRIQNKMQDLANFVDLPVQMGGNPPSYTALKDQNGELIAALADMQLYDNLDESVFPDPALQNKIRQAGILVTDANFPQKVLSAIGELVSVDCQWYAVATSPAKVNKFRPTLHHLTLLSMNLNEAAELTALADHPPLDIVNKLRDMGLKSGIITDGPRGLSYFTHHDEIINLSPFSSDNILDVTGAGDATLAGFIASMLTGKSIKDALQAGLAAAKITIETKGACSEQLSMRSIADVRAAY